MARREEEDGRLLRPEVLREGGLLLTVRRECWETRLLKDELYPIKKRPKGSSGKRTFLAKVKISIDRIHITVDLVDIFTLILFKSIFFY